MSITEVELRNLLNRSLKDENNRLLSASRKLDKTNESVRLLVNNLDYHYLTEIQGFDTNKTITSGFYAISGLTTEVAMSERGIIHVNINGGNNIDKIEVWELRKQDNDYSVASLEKPLYYVQQNRIYVLPSAISSIDVLYLQVQTDMATGGTCNLNSSLKNLIVKIAEGNCRTIIGDTKNIAIGSALLSSAFQEIRNSNAMYATKSDKTNRKR